MNIVIDNMMHNLNQKSILKLQIIIQPTQKSLIENHSETTGNYTSTKRTLNYINVPYASSFWSVSEWKYLHKEGISSWSDLLCTSNRRSQPTPHPSEQWINIANYHILDEALPAKWKINRSKVFKHSWY